MKEFRKLGTGDVFARTMNGSEAAHVMKKTGDTTARHFAAFGKHKMFWVEEDTDMLDPDEIVQPLAFERPMDIPHKT